MASSVKLLHVLLLSATVVVILASAQPSPSVVFSVTPTTKSASPTARQVVTDENNAFMSYIDTQGAYVQYVKPSSPSTVFTNGIVTDAVQGCDFHKPPIAVRTDAAIVFSTCIDSSFVSILTPTKEVFRKTRSGSTADVAYAPDLDLAFIPYGGSRRTGEEFVLAVNVTAALLDLSEDKISFWTASFPLPTGRDSTIESPIYNEGKLYFMYNNTLVVLDAKTGKNFQFPVVVNPIVDPCGLTPEAGNDIQLRLVMHGQADVPLNALILYANTTSVANGNEFSICRLSHRFGTAEWTSIYKTQMTVHAITGGHETLFIAGKQENVNQGFSQYVVRALSANAGHEVWAAPKVRSYADRLSMPETMGVPLALETNVVFFQVNGNLTAYNVTTGNLLYVAQYPCHERPVTFVPMDRVICIGLLDDVQDGVYMLRGTDGSLIWRDKALKTRFRPTLVTDSYVFAQNIDNVLVGLSMDAAQPPGPPRGDGDGVGAGEVILILLVVGFVGTIVVVMGFRYFKKLGGVEGARRRGITAEVEGDSKSAPAVYGGLNA